MGDAPLDEAVRPIANRACGRAKHCFLRFADAKPAGRGMRPWEECQDRARFAGLVAIIEMISLRIVEVDGLLDQAKSEGPRVEIDIAARRTRDRRDMVDAIVRHCQPSGGSSPPAFALR